MSREDVFLMHTILDAVSTTLVTGMMKAQPTCQVKRDDLAQSIIDLDRILETLREGIAGEKP